jgi:hypothetical protein
VQAVVGIEGEKHGYKVVIGRERNNLKERDV